MLLYIIRDINIGIALITYNKGGGERGMGNTLIE